MKIKKVIDVKAYTNGWILDGTVNMVPTKGKAILTKGERIESIVEESEIPSSYKQIDLQGQYIMPGLINLHVHLPASGKPKKKQSDVKKLVKIMTSNALLRWVAKKLCESYAKTQLLSGVTTIRTVGGIINIDSILRDEIASGKIIGPRILASNMAVSVPDGHMAGSLAYEATSPEEAAMFVRKIAEDHPDWIKLMITGGVLDAKVKGEPGELKMEPDLIRAACEEAHRLGLKVAAHVESPTGVKEALKNGVDTIEHGAKPDKEMIELFKKTQAAQVATFSPALPYALFDRSISGVSEVEQFNGDVVFKGIIECAKACLANDIPVGLGTDTGCPYITQYDMWREVNYFQKYCGISNAFALHTATQRNAEIAGLGNEVGTIEPGKCADFVVTKNNPLENLEALRNASMVVTRGNIIQNPVVKKMSEVEKALDQFK